MMRLDAGGAVGGTGVFVGRGGLVAAARVGGTEVLAVVGVGASSVVSSVPVGSTSVAVAVGGGDSVGRVVDVGTAVARVGMILVDIGGGPESAGIGFIIR